MSQIEKLLHDMTSNPRTVRYPDLVRVLEYHGVAIRPGKGSHRVAEKDGDLYTVPDPGPGKYLHPKTVKNCLRTFDLWK